MWPKTAPNGPKQAKTPPKHSPNMILKARDPDFLSRTFRVLDKKLGSHGPVCIIWAGAGLMWPKTAPNGPKQAKIPPKHGPNMNWKIC
jgi:hypothetical protein